MTLRCLIGACALCFTSLTPSDTPAGESPDVVRVLHQWQQASAEQTQPSIEQNLAAFADQLSAHELQAAAELCGPVSARALIQQYEWTSAINDAGDAVLTAVPRDQLGRLFFSAVEIEFPADSPSPRRLRFHSVNRRGEAVTIAVPPANGRRNEPGPLRTAAGDIQLTSLVSLEDDDQQTAAPQVAEVLAAWETATRSVGRAEIEFVRYTYDLTVGIEERAAGQMRYEAPNNGSYELRPFDIHAVEASARTDPQGTPLTIRAARPLLLYWDDNHLVMARPGELTYMKLPIPKPAGAVVPAGSTDRMSYSLTRPQRAMPGAVDVHSDDFTSRFEWSVLKQDPQRIILQGWPSTDADQREVSELQVVLDPRTHLAQATRLVSADRHKETIHVLKQFRINDDVRHQNWRPDLSLYTEQDPAPLAPPADDEPKLPTSSKE